MDTSGFFQYPGTELPLDGAPSRGFLGASPEEDWDLLLEHTDTLLFRPGQVVLQAGTNDRALYLLTDGRLTAPGGELEPVTTFGEAAFFDGRPRAVTVTAASE